MAWINIFYGDFMRRLKPNCDLVRVGDAVEYVLQSDKRARNCDTWLIMEVLRRLGYKIYIPWEDIEDMPSLESITRIRRLLQHEGKYLSEDEVFRRRMDGEKEVRCNIVSGF